MKNYSEIIQMPYDNLAKTTIHRVTTIIKGLQVVFAAVSEIARTHRGIRTNKHPFLIFL
jgi:hypothetical protein